MWEEPGDGRVRERLCDLIEHESEAVLAEWERRVRALPVAEGLSSRALRDHLPLMLERIHRIVRSIHTGEGAPFDDVADRHALDRLDEGFDLQSVVREIALLRDVILDRWQQRHDAVAVAEVRRLDAVVDQAIAMSAHRFARAHERTLAALDRVSSAALGTGDLETYLPRLSRALLETSDAADAVLVLLREEGDRLRVRAAAGVGEDVARGFSLRVGEGFAGRIAQTCEPLLVHDASTNPLVLNPALRGSGLQALYGVPLLHEGRVEGVVMVGSRSAFDFSDGDKQLMRVMAQRATSLLVQARLATAERRARALARERERALQESEQRFRSALERAPFPIAIHDDSGRMLFLNAAWTRLSGYRPEEIPTLGDWIARAYGGSAAQRQRIERLYALEQPEAEGEFTLRTKDGRARVWDFSAAPLGVLDGRRAVISIGADVTERRAAEDELLRLAEFLDLGDAFFTLDRDWRITRVNRMQERLSGKPRTETLGRVFWEVWPETARPDSVYWTGYHRAMDERVPTYFVEYFAPLDLWTDVSAYPTREGGIAVFFRDASERKRAEEALRHQEALVRTILDNATSAFVMLDERATAMFLNPQAQRLTGFSTADLAGRLLHDCIHRSAPDGRGHAASDCPLARVFAEQRRLSGEDWLVRRDGSFLPVEYAVVPVVRRGRLDGALLEFRDIGERRAAERETRRAREELDRIVGLSPDAIVVAGFDGYFKRVNPAFVSLLGWSEQELLATPRHEFIHPDDREATRAQMRAVERGAATARYENRYRRRDGAYRWLSWNAVRDPERPQFVAAARDVTEEKRAHEFERQLLGIVSHDLRGPLTTILMSATVLQRRAGELDDRTVKVVSRIHASTERAARLVGDLLDFTRARLGGGIPVNPRPADLHAIVRQVVDETRGAFPGREVRLEATGPGAGTWDPDRLAQVVSNLLTNALKYSPPQTPVHVRSRGADAAVELEVRNEGDPIPPADLARIFEPMYRGAAPADPGTRSVGLGLYIVSQIVRAHDGVVDVTSSAEQGTVFRVRLPRR